MSLFIAANGPDVAKEKHRDSEDLHPEPPLPLGAETAQDPESLATIQSNSPPYSIFSKKKKLLIIFFAGFGGFFSPLSANIYFPALTTLTREYNVSSTLMNLTLTSYLIFQGLAPTISGDLADMAGRRPAYIIGFIIYIGANIGLALQNSFAALFILRCLQSSGSSGTIALAAGVMADFATPAERGVWMGYVMSGSLIAPAIGPVIGGILSEYLTWRSIFWFLTILAVIFLIPFAIFMPETGRNVVGNGSIPPRGWNMSLLDYFSARKAKETSGSTPSQTDLPPKPKLRFPNPLGTLKIVTQKDAGLLLFFNSLVYTASYLVIGSAPYLLEQIYGFNDLQIGLCFIPFGFGGFLAPLTSGRIMDWNYRRVAAKLHFTIDKKRGDDLRNFPLERVRLMVSVPFLVLGLLALLCYGWVLQVETHLAVPLILQFLIGLLLMACFNAMNVMLVDYFPTSPSTATAANNLVRCLMGAGGTAVINLMIEKMGRGWCFTFVAGVCAAFSPVLWVLLKWGPGWREERRVRIEVEKESR